ncbi:MAG: hypothetical protein GXY83_14335 [Rhodopirellula sp.]|nr:hypothetical protein [Rhodopirellula sp.]
MATLNGKDFYLGKWDTNGQPTSEAAMMKIAIRILQTSYGKTAVVGFGPSGQILVTPERRDGRSGREEL